MTKPNDASGKQKSKREHDVHVRGTIHTNLSPDEEQRHNAERKQDAATHEAERKVDMGRESHKVWLERFTLLAVVVYAGITFWQGCLVRKQGKIIAQQFEIARSQQRAFVEITDDAFERLKLEDIQTLVFTIENQNVGKSTASKVHGEFVVEFPLAQQEPSFNFNQTRSAVTEAPLFPGGPQRSVQLSFIPGYGLGEPIPPTLKQELGTGSRYAVIFGRVEYDDPFGHWWTQFCVWRHFVTTVNTPKTFSFLASRCIDFNTEGGTPKKEEE